MNQTFSIGNTLATGFRVWFKNLVPFLVISLIIATPLLLWGVFTVQGEMTLDRLDRIQRFLGISTVAGLVLNIFVSAALTYGVVMELRGHRASIGACIVTGLTRLLPALGVGLLSTLAIIGGSILLIVPGIIIACMLYVATQASVLEHPGLVGALRRSRHLTAGHRLEIFGLMLLLGLLGYGVQKLVEAILVPHASDPAHIGETLRNLPTYVYATLGTQILMTSIGAVMAASAYFLLRSEKEGASASDLARVFE